MINEALKTEAAIQVYGALMDAYIEKKYFSHIFFFCDTIIIGTTYGEQHAG